MSVKHEENIRYKLMNIEQKIADLTMVIMKKGKEYENRENKIKKEEMKKIEKLWNNFEKIVDKLYEKRRKLENERVEHINTLTFMKKFPELQEEIYRLHMFSKTKNFNSLNWLTNSLLKKYEIDEQTARNIYNTGKSLLVMEESGYLNILHKNSNYFNKRPSSTKLPFTYGDAKSLIIVRLGLTADMKKQIRSKKKN